MRWYPDSFLALPEDALAFAWSAPMRELAIKIGISDVALRKLLNAHGIVTRPQGHWNRVHVATCERRDTDIYGRMVATCKVGRLDLAETHTAAGDEFRQHGGSRLGRTAALPRPACKFDRSQAHRP